MPAAAALAATLPADLTPPAVDPNLRIVSAVAADIDDDGDLDVVANTGSVDLLVWINDGTGRLESAQPKPSKGRRSEPPEPTFDVYHDASEACTPAGPFVDFPTRADRMERGPSSPIDCIHADVASVVADHRNPRGLPASFRT